MPILNWLGRDEALKTANKTPYRLLEEVPELGYGDKTKENMIVQGDNLEALKALLPFYAGQVKCIYIDPPYNTKKAFDSYDDNLEHSIWLKMMYPRLELLWSLLKEDGILLISINDDEMHYLKVICDEIFGRKSFINTLIWHYEGNTDNQAKIINYHEYILVYSKKGKIDNVNVIDPNITSNSKLYKSEIRNTVVKNSFKNPPSTVVIPRGFPANFEKGVIYKDKVNFPKYDQDIVVENWQVQNSVRATTGWSSKNILLKFISNNLKEVEDSKKQLTRFEMTKTGAIEGVKTRKLDKGHFVSVLRGFGTTHQMSQELAKLGLNFDYPKPVDLIAYLIKAFTDEKDIVLDSFAGSGTTACSILKLNQADLTDRQFILIEMLEDTAKNVIVPRLKNLYNNTDLLGGFRFYKLGNEVFDAEGNINENISFENLSAHIWFTETKTPFNKPAAKSTFLGTYNNVSYALLYNGILRDKRVDGGNVLTNKTLNVILEDMQHQPYEKLVIYGESSRISQIRLKSLNIEFKQTPYDIKAR